MKGIINIINKNELIVRYRNGEFIGRKIEHTTYGIGEIKNTTENSFKVYFTSKGDIKLGIDFV